MDEAGTDPKEGYCVVSAVIINGDAQYLAMERAIKEVIQNVVPSTIQDGFYYHAKDLYGKLRSKHGLDFPEINRITEAFIEVAHRAGAPVVLGHMRRPEYPGKVAHLEAFGRCAMQCDMLIRELWPDEIASLIAEDIDDRETLKRLLRAIKKKGPVAGHPLAGIYHITNGIQFCEKQDSALLQLADACAYAWKRYLTGARGGDILGGYLMGPQAAEPEFRKTALGGGQAISWRNPPLDALARSQGFLGSILRAERERAGGAQPPGANAAC